MIDARGSAAPTEPPRVLSGVDATCVVIGAIVGVGIFFTPSDVARLVHSEGLALIAWAVGGVIALCGALAFAELGGMYRASGAQYEVLRDSYGPLSAFVFVFCIITVIEPGSIGVMAIICADNLLAAAGVEMDRSTEAAARTAQVVTLGLGVALIVLLTAANVIGARLGARIQNVTVYAKLVALLAVVGLASFAAPLLASSPSGVASTQPPSEPSAFSTLKAVLASLVPILFAYGGWQQVLWVAGEVKEPRRNLPRSIIVGVFIVIVVYLLTNWAYLRLLGVDGVANSTTLASDAVGMVMPNLGSRIVAAAVAVSAFGVLNAQLLTAPRLIYGMAADGRFFGVFARLNRRTATPALAIILLTGISIVMLIASSLPGQGKVVNNLVTAVVFVDGLFFALTGAAVIVLRYRRPNADRPAKTPLYPLVPLLFALGELGALTGALLVPEARLYAILAGAWAVLGMVVYLSWFRRPAEPVPTSR